MNRISALCTLVLFAGTTTFAQTACSAARKPTAQEAIVKRDIQEALDQQIEELGAKDLNALSRRISPEFTLRLLDGTTLNREQMLEGMRQDLQSILNIDVDRTHTQIECLTLKGSEATVYTKQQYVRTLPDRKNGSPHEVATSVRHRETWVYTKDGWVGKRIEEIEQGPTTLDGEPYQPR